MRVIEQGEATVLELAGAVGRSECRALYDAFERLLAKPAVRRLRVDLSRVTSIDSAFAVTVSMGRELFVTRGKACELVGMKKEHAAAIALLGRRTEPPPLPPHEGMLELVGGATLSAGRAVLHAGAFVARTLRSLGEVAIGRQPMRIDATIEQAVIIGVNALFIVLLLGALIGIILAFQGAHQLEKFGVEIFMAELVGVGMVREFGPMITAIILAGRSGAAMSAELGIMKVNEEILALEAMGIDAQSFLVVPRLVAITVVQPLLSVMSMAIGMVGGVLVAKLVGLPPVSVIRRMEESLYVSDLTLGLLKSVLFAWIVGLVSCGVGLRTRGGAHGVAASTTRGVVVSIVLIVVVDSIVTTAWTLIYD